MDGSFQDYSRNRNWIVSSSFMQATWTPINSQIGLKFGQIGPWTVGLAALEHLENLHRLIMREML